ncbi:MAG TPA: hypothetical protein DCE41_21285 [Cytophagales bacterium]|nr:hypothetical protein [Cytophagales bacterium]HAA21473.1 hypothetical protein [Cytophagales bacterium]HAP65221.1 hypothetical protein [Cytophagales bacterium]
MRRILLLLFVITALGGAFFFFSRSFQGEVYQVNLAIKEPGKTYLYSQEPTSAVMAQLAKGHSPMVLPQQELLVEGETLFVQPIHLQALVQVMAGEVTTHEYPEPSFDGYLSAQPAVAYRMETANRATETVGEQVIEYTVTLTNSAGKEKRIRWTLNPTTYDPQALENCMVEKFKVQTQPGPGEIITYVRSFPVVSLQELAAFYGVNVRWEQSTGLLYISL